MKGFLKGINTDVARETAFERKMADSIMLATARAYEATLWTQDADFAKVADVKYTAKHAES